MKRSCLCILLALLLLFGTAQADITLPADTTEIAEEAFRNVPIRRLVLPEGVRTIGPRAFQGTGLTQAELPAGVVSIGEDAFDTGRAVVLTVLPGSPAQAACDAVGVPYILKGYEDSMPFFHYAWVDEYDGTVEISCTTNMTTEAIVLLDDNGAEVCRWTTGFTENGLEKHWELEMPASEAVRGWLVPVMGDIRGEREPFLRSSSGGSSDSPLYSFYAQDRTEIWLGKDGYVNVPFIAGQAAEFAVYTKKPVAAFRVIDGDGRVLYEESGLSLPAYRTYSFSFALADPGAYTLFLEASGDGETFVRHDDVMECEVTSGAKVLYAAADPVGSVGQPWGIHAYATPNAQKLGLFDGDRLIQEWDSFEGGAPLGLGEDEDGGDVLYAFPEAGDYALTLKACDDAGVWGQGTALKARISAGPSVLALETEPVFVTMADKMLTVVTTLDAETLRWRNDDGAEFEWDREEAAEERDGKLYWTVWLGIAGSGFYACEFAAGNEAAGYGNAYPCYFTVAPEASVYHMYFDDHGPDEPASINVATHPAAKYLRLTDESGNVLYETEANEDVMDYGSFEQCNYWCVEYNFGGAGQYVLAASASADGEHWSQEVWDMIELRAEEEDDAPVYPWLHGTGTGAAFTLRGETEALQQVQAITLADVSGAVLKTWTPEDFVIEKGYDDEEYDEGVIRGSCALSEPGCYGLVLSYSLDGETFRRCAAETITVRPHELTGFSTLDDLAQAFGPLKCVRSVMNEYASTFAESERLEACYTPADDPGWLYVSENDMGDGIGSWKLCGARDWTLFGLRVGMDYAEMTRAASERGLVFNPDLAWDPEAEMLSWMTPRPGLFIYVFMEDGLVTEIRTAPIAGG